MFKGFYKFDTRTFTDINAFIPPYLTPISKLGDVIVKQLMFKIDLNADIHELCLKRISDPVIIVASLRDVVAVMVLKKNYSWPGDAVLLEAYGADHSNKLYEALKNAGIPTWRCKPPEIESVAPTMVDPNDPPFLPQSQEELQKICDEGLTTPKILLDPNNVIPVRPDQEVDESEVVLAALRESLRELLDGTYLSLPPPPVEEDEGEVEVQVAHNPILPPPPPEQSPRLDLELTLSLPGRRENEDKD